ncbi:glycosyltransferase family 2 protein [Bordetella petrii]|uniref:Glycosyltransferase family A protein n=1 Tax=Bordetella petrii TaxID=94624 RepID=A0ABT7W192_9BORD|nr:glycosyltransferase family A protein [Bordetella petrii]MDM9558938.1 glycosyltransferase family A protein [Bordetella petrii]
MPKVSVVVPVYNLEFYIERCLASLARQTCQDIEVLVVNDGGTDDSQLIIDEYVAQYPAMFKSFIKPNGGHGAACNYGIERATGEYIIIVDGDDFLDPDAIEFMYDKAQETGADLLIGNLRYYFVGRTQSFKPVPFESERELSDADRDLLYRNWATPCGRIYHRSIFADPDVRLLPGIFFADANFVPKSYLVAKKIYYVDKELYNYDNTRPTQSMQQTDKRILNIVPALQDMLAFYRKKGQFDAKRKQLMWYVGMHCVAWIRRVKTLVGYPKLKALQEVFAVADENFGDDWLKTGIIWDEFGRKVHRGVKIARAFNYAPIAVFWRLTGPCSRIDRGVESVLNFPLRAYRAVKRRLLARLGSML